MEPPEPLPDPRLLRIARRLGVSRAVFFSILNRGWQFLAGPVSVVVIARFFTTDQQGFYYAFASILAMHSFFELGLFNAIVNITSHEWAHLSWSPSGEAVGSERALSRLRSFARFLLRWYLAVAIFFFIVVSVAGSIFLSQDSHPGINWFAPWIAVVAITAAQLVCIPFNSFLEGCNRVASVNRFQLVQAILGAAALWIVIPAGGGLWALAVSAAARTLSNLAFLSGEHGRFLRDILTHDPTSERMTWRTEVWPIQWRIGVQGGVSWFHYSLFVPVLFHYEGPASAGLFGMTWQVVSLIQVAAYAWVQTRIPEMGVHVARGEYEKLNALWRRAIVLCAAVLLAGAVGFEVVLVLIQKYVPDIGGRMLDPGTTAILLAGRFVFLIVLALAAYVRAHRIEPFAPMMVAVSLMQGTFAWLSGMRYGASGQAWSYLVISVGVALPWAIYIYRRTIRQEQTRPPSAPRQEEPLPAS